MHTHEIKYLPKHLTKIKKKLEFSKRKSYSHHNLSLKKNEILIWFKGLQFRNHDFVDVFCTSPDDVANEGPFKFLILNFTIQYLVRKGIHIS